MNKLKTDTNLLKTDVSKSFYCNEDDGEYNNNPCSEQCDFCKQVEVFLKYIC